MQPGDILNPGDFIVSPDGAYRMIMQGDGNLVLYDSSRALWSSGVQGPGTKAAMQADGNLVLYKDGVAKWSSNTADYPGSVLQLQNDGNAVIYHAGRAVWYWAGGYVGDTGNGGTVLGVGDYMYSSNHAYFLVMQGDGNLVLYHRAAQGNVALWSSGAQGGGAFAQMQYDGNLVVYNGGVAKWSSNTADFPSSTLRVQDDGNLVIYNAGHAVWSWSPGYTGDTGGPGTVLAAGQYMYSSNHAYFLVMQGDGNLVFYHRAAQGNVALWSSGAQGGGAFAQMQYDGNLVVYNGGVAKWNSGTAGHAGAFFRVQDDSNFVIYEGNSALWTRASGGSPGGGGSGPPGSGQAVVNAAASQAGQPYCWAGGNISGPTHGSGGPGCPGGTVGFDCTGLVIYALYQAFHITGRPHSAGTGWASGGQQIAKAQIQPGDVLFFGGTGLSNFQHAGIYAGNGMMWNAPNYNVPVKLSNVANWEKYSQPLVAAYRYG